MRCPLLLSPVALLPFLFSCTQTEKKLPDFDPVIDQHVLEQHLKVLAAPKMEGRETSTEGERKAAAYIEKVFTQLGLEPATKAGYEMPFTVFRDSVLGVRLRINGQDCVEGKDFTLNLNFDHQHQLEFSEAVFAGYGISTRLYDDYKDLDVKGKLVIIHQGEPIKDSIYLATGAKEKTKWSSAREKLRAAEEHHAAALLIIKKDFSPGDAPERMGRMYVDTSEHPLPAFFISEKMARRIFKGEYQKIAAEPVSGIYEKIAPVKTEIAITDSCTTITSQSRNLLAVLPGTDKKNEYIFITAHYDHLGKKGEDIYYGADDNGSGTSAVLAIAKVFAEAKKAGHPPRRSIVFMLVSGEEKGLLGSKYYTTHPVFPLNKTSVNLNIDMIGRVGEEYHDKKDSLNYLYLIGDDKLSSDLRPISQRSNQSLKLVLDDQYNQPDDPNRFYYRSDHYNFAKHGVPIIFYFNGVHKDYHRPGDTVDKINFELMRKRAQLVLNTAWEMAGMDRMLKRDIPLEE